MSIENEPKLYVGTYSAYNNGSLKGEWVDLTNFDDSSEFYEYCAKLHYTEEDPEFMFQDFEGFPKNLYCECGGVDDIYEYINFCKKSYLNQDCIDSGLELDIPLDKIEYAYCGEFSSDEDFAYNMAEETGDLDKDPHWPYTFIDWERAARELMYDYVESNGYYFNRNY